MHVLQRYSKAWLALMPISTLYVTYYSLIEEALIVVQVFEIENQYESALDTNFDLTDEFSRGQRRPSGDSHRRDPQSYKIIPRIRLSSGVNRSTEFQPASPLAQVFNPIVMDEDPRLHSKTRSQSISFGPATRRRTTSMLPLQMPTSERGAQQSNQNPQNFLWPGNPSPRYDDDNSSPSKETIIKAEDELENGGLDVTIMQRLHRMEQHQHRIEDILLQLSQGISGSRS